VYGEQRPKDFSLENPNIRLIVNEQKTNKGEQKQMLKKRGP
jgi:hypothetical protein